MKQLLSFLIASLIWLSPVAPAQANFLIDGGYINDMKVLMKGSPNVDIATRILDANKLAWVDLGKSYCEMRKQGMSRSEILNSAKTQIQEVEDSQTSQAVWLLNTTMAHVAEGTYCPEVS